MTRRSWLRGLIQRAGTTTIIFVVALVATAAAAAGPIYYQAARTSILRDTIAAAPAAARGYEVNQTGPVPGLLAAMAPVQQDELNHDLGPLADRGVFAPPIYSVETSLPFPQETASIPLIWRTAVCAHLRIDGTCPAAQGQIIISQSTAAVTGWRIGRQLRFAGQHPLTVTGIYRLPDQNQAYWFGRGTAYFPQDSTIDAFFTVRSTLERGPAEQQGTAVVDDLLDLGRITGGEVAPLQAAMTTFLDSQVLTDQQIIATTAIPGTLQSVSSGWSSMTVPVVLITLQLLALCLLLLFLAVTDAIEARGPEIALAKLRGRGAVSTAMFGLSEPVLLLLLALPAGTLAGWGASALLSHVLLRPGTQVSLPALGWVSAAVAAAGGLAAAVLAAQRTLRRPVLEEWRRSGLRLNSRGWVVDGVLATGAAAGLLELLLSGQVSSARPGTLILLVPGLIGLAVAVIASRLLPLACRAAFPRTGRRGDLGVFLALRQVARRPGGVRATMVLATAITLATFAVSAWTVGHANEQRVADLEVGAPTVLTVGVPAGKDLGTLVGRADPGGRQAAVVDSYTSFSSGNAGLTTLAVDPERFARVAAWPAVHGEPSPASLAARLAPQPSAPVVLTGSAVRVTVKVSDLSLPGAQLSADVTTGSSPVSLGALPAHGTATLTGSLTGCPCVLQDLDISPPTTALGSPVMGSVTFTGWQVQDGSGWVPASPHALTPASAWRPGHADQPADQLQAGAAGLSWQFDSHPRQDAVLDSANRPALLPAVISASMLGRGQTQVTGVGLDGSPVGLQVISAATAVPGAPTSGVIVDRTYAELAAGEDLARATQQVWVTDGAQHTIESRLRADGVDITSVRNAGAVAAGFARQGPALASVLFLADAAAATLLAAGAAVLDLYLSARRRRYEYAALSASGVPRRTLRRAVLTELALVLGFGGVIGVVTGVIAAMLTLHSVPEFLTAPPAPILSYVPPVIPLVMLAAVAAALLTAAAVLASSTLIRGVSLDQLRETPT